MPNHPLFYPVNDQVRTGSLRDQIQIALAIADATMLRSLLVNCIPAMLGWQHIGAVSTELSVPTGDQQAADGILHFEAIRCVLGGAPYLTEMPTSGGWTRESRELARLTRYESEMRTLGQNLPLAPLVSLLAESGFCPQQIEAILRLPRDGWHKSWWYAIDAAGEFTLPFLRHIRLLHYADGSFTVQYKDFFEQEKPSCFSSQPQKLLLAIKTDSHEFSETLKRINYQRQALGIPRALLICNTISELEAQGFISQGINVYPAAELVLPTRSNCTHCARRECPMNGTTNSPIAMCYGFVPENDYL
jgi:hypothetical protein